MDIGRLDIEVRLGEEGIGRLDIEVRLGEEELRLEHKLEIFSKFVNSKISHIPLTIQFHKVCKKLTSKTLC
ncbi:MAG: hypothetical protein DRH15_14655, partial [Deltaproteobacteria bacterium]